MSKVQLLPASSLDPQSLVSEKSRRPGPAISIPVMISGVSPVLVKTMLLATPGVPTFCGPNESDEAERLPGTGGRAPRWEYGEDPLGLGLRAVAEFEAAADDV